MQSFNLLALKLWICIGKKEWTLEKYIIRFWRQNETFLLIFKDCEKAAQGNGPP